MPIGLWKTASGAYLSSVKGLTPEQIEMFRNLKAGDRLILFVNSFKERQGQPDLSLDKMREEHVPPL